MSEHDGDFYRRVLNRAHKTMVSDLQSTDLLDKLHEKGFLPENQLRDIQELHTTSMKNRILMSKVSQKGKEGYFVFKDCLKSTHQDHLVKELETLEKALDEEMTRRHQNQPPRAYNLSELDRKISDRELASIAQAIGNSWDLIASYLDVSFPELQRIKMDHRYSAVEQIYHMFMSWKTKKGPGATVLALISALRESTGAVIDWMHIENKLGPAIRDVTAQRRPPQEQMETDVDVGRGPTYKPPLTDSDLNNRQQQSASVFVGQRPTSTSAVRQPMSASSSRKAMEVPDVDGLGIHSQSVEKTGGSCLFEPNRVIEIRKCLFDGRLIQLDWDDIDKLKRASDDEMDRGIQGNLYFISNKDIVPSFNMPLVVKELTITGEEVVRKMRSITNEKLASKVIHFAIVPLLAFGEPSIEKLNQTSMQTNVSPTYHFVLPYLQNRDLFVWIAQDNTILRTAQTPEEKSPVLDQYRRTKIMYQIAAAVDYLHTPVSNVRSCLLHMDIKSTNIVLDEVFNARLIDFGLARELKEGDPSLQITASELIGTAGYFPTRQFKELAPKHDYHNFGIVMRELLSGYSPTAIIDNQGQNLRKIDGRNFRKHVLTDVWKEEKVHKTLANLSTDCIQAIYDGNTMTSKDIKKKIKSVLNDEPNQKLWERSGKNNASGDNCDICLVNPKIKNQEALSKHECGQIQVCVACMRNSFLNPIMCHSCDKEVLPLIGGDSWGAILIAGNDQDPGKARTFTQDIETLKDLFSSRTIPVMGISKQNIIAVSPHKPGEDENLKPKIKKAFEYLEGKLKAKPEAKPGGKPNSTVVIVVSSHGTVDHNIVLGIRKNGETNGKQNDKNENTVLRMEELLVFMKTLTNVEKFILLFDFCYPSSIQPCKPELPVDMKILQLNACRPGEKAGVNVAERSYSYFIKSVYKALANISSQNKEDPNTEPGFNDFVTVQSLQISIDKQYKRFGEKGKCILSASNLASEDWLFAYRYDYKVKMEFDVYASDDVKPLKCSVAPKDAATFEQLMTYLFDEYKGYKPETGTIEGADCLAIEIETGPKPVHREELHTIEKVYGAWVNRRWMRVSPRKPLAIQQGRVSINIDNIQFIEQLMEKAMNDEFEITGEEGDGRIFVLPVRKARRFDEWMDRQEDDLKEPRIESDGPDPNLKPFEAFSEAVSEMLHILDKGDSLKIIFKTSSNHLTDPKQIVTFEHVDHRQQNIGNPGHTQPINVD